MFANFNPFGKLSCTTLTNELQPFISKKFLFYYVVYLDPTEYLECDNVLRIILEHNSLGYLFYYVLK